MRDGINMEQYLESKAKIKSKLLQMKLMRVNISKLLPI